MTSQTTDKEINVYATEVKYLEEEIERLSGENLIYKAGQESLFEANSRYVAENERLKRQVEVLRCFAETVRKATEHIKGDYALYVASGEAIAAAEQIGKE